MIKFKRQTSSKNQIKSRGGDIQQTFLDHLNELRSRLLVVAVALLGGGVVGYIFHDAIAAFLLRPLRGEKLIYLTPAGGLDFIFKISLDVGILVATPVAMYQLYQYLAPIIRLQKRTQQFAIFVVTFSCLLAITGVLLGYLVILPSAMEFLANLSSKFVQPSLTATSYLDFVLMHSLGMAIIFQLPILMLFINLINGPLNPSKLFRFEKYILLGAIVLAALIAPPDIASQAIVAIPVFGMYQLGIIMIVIQNRMLAPRLVHLVSSQQPVIAQVSNNTTLNTVPRRSQHQPYVLSLKPAKPTRPRRPVLVDIMVAPPRHTRSNLV